MSDTVFVPMPKIPRLYREVVVTEKIDGTNASIHVYEDGTVRAASRNRWITQEDDNYGFAKFVASRESEIRSLLGIGSHFGEWWGAGIQRRYGILDKRFSLFNTERWSEQALPEGIYVVPFLATCSIHDIPMILEELENHGSYAVGGFMNPEGVVVYHKASGNLFKVLIENDAGHKGDAK